MYSSSSENTRAGALSASRRSEILHSLIPVAACAANAQLDAFAIRLSDALFAFAEKTTEGESARISLNAANFLKQNIYAFYYLASARLEEALRAEVEALEQPAGEKKAFGKGGEWALVSLTEMDNKVLVSNIGRPIEAQNADQLMALGSRLGYLLERGDLTVAQNPFRPDVFLFAVNDAWKEFNPDSETHTAILPRLSPEIFLDLGPVLQALNDTLVARGVLAEVDSSYKIKKSNAQREEQEKKDKEQAEAKLSQQLQRLFGSEGGGPGGVSMHAGGDTPLIGFLGGMQKNLFQKHFASEAPLHQQSAALWNNIKQHAPAGALSQADEKTVDLLKKIFEVVFNDPNIPEEIKTLIGFLQVPVLKAALIDKDFFFKDEHPARRLIDALTKSSVAWDKKKGRDDPLFQTMKRSVERVQQEFDHKVSVFTDVVSDFENFVEEEDASDSGQLEQPISKAMEQEKLGQAQKTAKVEISHRVGTGEVVAFVETFLESRWVPVLTIAYTLQDERPGVVESAIKTMDDLIWSVKPKITLDQRKELIAKLPSILAALNKWLNFVKWNDAERLQFFADLADCHASIVRAPLVMSPERRLQIAVDAAKKAAERRMQKRASAPAQPVPDEYDAQVDQVQRGVWLDYMPKGGVGRKMKVAWISPMRSLFILTTQEKDESFSIALEELVQAFREGRAKPVNLGGMVGRALSQALEGAGANDPALPREAVA